MAKFDLKAAYRHVPVHPDDQSLLTIRWGVTTFLDTALPFGLCSAPKLFTAMANGLAWCIVCEGISHFLPYLDDFFLCPPSQAQDCGHSLVVAVTLCEDMGFPVAPDKLVGPSTTLSFLGIELDSVSMVMRLPRSKLEHLKASLGRWLGKKSARKRKLQSIIGQLSDAAIVFQPGRTFLRSLVEMAKIPMKQEHLVNLNGECKADLHWWDTFLDPAGDTVTSDASGSWGCCAFQDLQVCI